MVRTLRIVSHEISWLDVSKKITLVDDFLSFAIQSLTLVVSPTFF